MRTSDWRVGLLSEIRSDRNHWVGSLGPVLVLFWLSEIEPGVCRQLPAIARTLCDGQPDRSIAVLSIAGAATRPPSPEARAAIANLVHYSDANVTRVAVVREGGGFVTSTVLSIVTGIRLLAKPHSPHLFFTDLDEALRWVSHGFDAGRVDVDELRAAIDERRRELVSPRSPQASQTARA